MTDVVRACRRTWRRLGVEREVASEMAAELEQDLATAAAEGIRPQEYVAGDAQGFAAAWATGRGVVRPKPRIGTTVLAAAVGAVPGAGFGLFAAYGLSSQAMADTFGTPGRVGENAYENFLQPPTWLLLALYALGAVFAYGGAVAGVAALLRWRLDPAAGPTLRLLVVGLPAATAAAIGATVLFAWTQRFSTAATVVVADALVALAVFALCVAGIRLAAVVGVLRKERQLPARAS